MDRLTRHNWSSDSARCRKTERAVVIAESDMTDAHGMSIFLNNCRRSLRMRPAQLVIDLEHVEAADTKLVACLVFLFREAQRLSVKIEFRMSVAAETVIRLCRLDDMIGKDGVD